MKITKNTVLETGTVVTLRSDETLVITEVCREPDGVCYKVQFVEDDGDEYVKVGDERTMEHYELVGGEY